MKNVMSEFKSKELLNAWRKVGTAMAKADTMKDLLEEARDALDEAGVLSFPYEYVDDQMKTDLLIDNWDKITLHDLEKMVEGLRR